MQINVKNNKINCIVVIMTTICKFCVTHIQNNENIEANIYVFLVLNNKH